MMIANRKKETTPMKTIADLKRFIANLPDETLLVAVVNNKDYDVVGFDSADIGDGPAAVCLELEEA